MQVVNAIDLTAVSPRVHEPPKNIFAKKLNAAKGNIARQGSNVEGVQGGSDKKTDLNDKAGPQFKRDESDRLKKSESLDPRPIVRRALKIDAASDEEVDQPADKVGAGSGRDHANAK